MDIHSKHLIDRYLQGDLSGIELENFNRQMLEDKVFHEEVKFTETVYLGIYLAKEQQLKNKILTSINHRKHTIPYPLKLIFLFLFITLGGITLWFYVGNESSNTLSQRQVPWFGLFKKNDADNKSPQKDRSRRAENIKPAETNSAGKENVADSSASISSDGQLQETVNENSDYDSIPATGNTATESDIVKQDQLLISTALPVIDKTSDNKTESGSKDASSLTADAAKKLNPSADVPEEEDKIKNLEVEFWVSPINYRGYKMSKNKLLLFGVEQPDAVKLYRLNDVIYMSYFKDFYRLINTYDFIPYQKLKEHEISSALR